MTPEQLEAIQQLRAMVPEAVRVLREIAQFGTNRRAAAEAQRTLRRYGLSVEVPEQVHTP